MGRNDWNSVLATRSLWQQCDIIFASGESYHRASTAFPHSQVVEVSAVERFSAILNDLENRRFSKVGVLGHALSESLIRQPENANCCRQICSEQLFVVLNDNDYRKHAFRVALHRAGFYEIVEAHPSSGLFAKQIPLLDYSSVSGQSSGDYDLLSTVPYFQPNANDCCLIASRRALTMDQALPWELIGRPILQCKNSWFGGKSWLTTQGNEEITLAIDRSRKGCISSVSTTIRWGNHGTDSSFVGLVCCYQGPGDSGMYTGLLELTALDAGQISIWKCGLNWERIAFSRVAFQGHRHGADVHTADLTMAVSKDSVSFGVDRHAPLQISDADLKRNSCYGIRLRGDRFQVTGLSASSV